VLVFDNILFFNASQSPSGFIFKTLFVVIFDTHKKILKWTTKQVFMSNIISFFFVVCLYCFILLFTP